MDADERHESEPGVDAHRGRRGIQGEDVSRIISLSDGVFAFALTLLALTLAVPKVAAGIPSGQVSSNLAFLLQQDWASFLGYVFAFVMIGLWWIVHVRTFQFIGRFDSALVWLNMAMLLQIAVMPFVMNVYNTYSSTQVAVALFASIQVGLGVTSTLMWDYARRAKLLKPNVPADIAWAYSRRGWLVAAVFAGSIGVSFFSLGAAEATWILVFFVQRFAEPERVVGRLRRGRSPTLPIG